MKLLGNRTLCGALILAAALMSDAYAAPFEYAIDMGVGESDNIRRTPTNEQSETIGTVGFEFSLYKNTRRLFANVAGDLAYFEYFKNTYGGEFIGNLNGAVDLRLVPEHFSWAFQDNFGQVRSDPFAPVTPDNRENVNYFSTGPDFSFRFGEAARMQVSGRYSKVSYEVTPLDSDRYSGSFSLIHDISDRSSISGNVQTQKVALDNTSFGADYDTQQAYARYLLNGARTHASVDLGYTRLSQSGTTDNGALVRMELARRTSASSTVTLRLGREFSDAGDAFRMQQGLGELTLDTQTVTQTSNPFISEYATLGWDWTRERTGLGFSVSYFDENYKQQDTQDVARTMGSVYVSRSFTSSVRLALTGTYTKDDYKNVPGDYREVGGSAILSWRIGRKLWLNVQYERYDRSSDLTGGDYKENRAWLRLRYGAETALQAPSPFLQRGDEPASSGPGV